MPKKHRAKPKHRAARPGKRSLQTPEQWSTWNNQIADWWEAMDLVDVVDGEDDTLIITSRRTGYTLTFWTKTNRAQYGFRESSVFRISCLDHYLKTKFV